MQTQLREQAKRLQNLTNQATTQGKLSIALDDTQQHMKAQLELDFLIVSEKLKQEVADALSGEAAGKALRAFKKVVELLSEAKPPVPGAAELHALCQSKSLFHAARRRGGYRPATQRKRKQRRKR